MYKMIIVLVLLSQMAHAKTDCKRLYMDLVDYAFQAGKLTATSEVLVAHAKAGNFVPSTQESAVKQANDAEEKYAELLNNLGPKNPTFYRDCLK